MWTARPPSRRPGTSARSTEARSADRGAVMARFTMTVTAEPEDIDVLGHVNNAVWVKWIQDIAVAHWNAVAPAEHRDVYIWVVTRHEIDYRGNVSEGETVT